MSSGRKHKSSDCINSIWDLKKIASDRDENLKERMTALGMLLGFFAGIWGSVTMIISGVHWIAIVLNIVILLAAPLFLLLVHRRFHRVVEIRHVITVYVIFTMPVFWFYSGGATAGGTLWMLFVILYISLIHNGREMYVYLGIAVFVDSMTFILGVVWAERLYFLNDINMMYINTYMSLLGVAAVIAVGVNLLKQIYVAENRIANERADELEQLKSDLEQKNRALESMNENQKRFLSVMAHEMRNPLNGIIGYNQMIKDCPYAPDDVRGYAAGCLVSSQGLLQIINDILDYSKMDAQKLSIHEKDYNLREIVEGSVSIFRILAREKGIQLSCKIDASIPERLNGDEVRIKQILTNLISNAVKYTKQGAVSVTVEKKDGEEEQLALIMTVKDTGAGISPEGLDVLFIPYTRLKEEENKYIQGTGLGLSIVKNLLDLMHGSIQVSSQVGVGSVFTVTLPQKPAVSQKEEPAPEQMEIKFSGKRVLCVDDMKLNRNLFCMMLKSTEIEVDTAPDGETALDMIRQNTYDLIFLDRIMPGMNGIDVLHKIKEQKQGENCLNAATPVIAFTATELSDRKVAAVLKEKFDGILEKPVKYAELMAVLRKYLL